MPVRFPLDGSAADPQRWRRLTFWVRVKPRLSWEQQEDQRSREAVPSSRPGPSLPLQSPAPSWDLIYSGFFKGKFGLRGRSSEDGAARTGQRGQSREDGAARTEQRGQSSKDGAARTFSVPVSRHGDDCCVWGWMLLFRPGSLASC